MNYLRALAAALLVLAMTAASAGQTMSAYTKRLHDESGKLVHFTTKQAAVIVLDFNIACPNRDGRFVPLINVLYTMAGMINAADEGLKGRIVVENRGKNVRVFRTYYPRKDGERPFSDMLMFEISEWNELHLHGIRKEAVLMFCTDYYGQPWELPAASR